MARRVVSAHRAIVSRKTPRPSGVSVSAAVIDSPGQTLYAYGILPRTMPSGKTAEGPIRQHAEVVLGNMRNLVAEAGFVTDEVVAATVYLTDFKQLPIFEELWRKSFVGASLPTRNVLLAAGLPDGALLSIDIIAVKKADPPPEAPPAPPADPGYEEEFY